MAAAPQGSRSGTARRHPGGRPAAPFIVGIAGSGTTLLRASLEAHPMLAIPPETHFLADLVGTCEAPGAGADRVIELLESEPHWPLFELPIEAVRDRLPARGAIKPKAALRAFYEAYAQARGRPRWGDETPGYLHNIRLISRHLPEAAFVHVVRDVRDAALAQVDAGQLRPDAIPAAAWHWAQEVGRAVRLARRVKRYLLVRYEDLLEEPEAVLRRVCEFAELSWESSVADAHRAAVDAARADRPQLPRAGTRAVVADPPGGWRERMAEADRAACQAAAGELLAQLGYEVAGMPVAPAPG